MSRRERTHASMAGDQPGLYRFGSLDLFDFTDFMSSDSKGNQPKSFNREFTRTRTNLKTTHKVKETPRLAKSLNAKDRRSLQEAKDKEKAQQFKATAATYVHVSCFEKAVELYDKVLEIDASDTEALLTRALCQCELKKFRLASEDAEAVIDLDNTVAKAHGIRGESLYQLGEFEMALVAFYRGQRLRPMVKEYAQGIEKCKIAIGTAIGENSGIKLDLSGDLSYFKQYSQGHQNVTPYIRATRPLPNPKPGHSLSTSRSPDVKRKQEDPKTVKKLLQELYGDYKYLEQLLQDEKKTLQKMQSEDKKEEKIKQREAEEKKQAITGSYDFEAREETESSRKQERTLLTRQRNKKRNVSQKIMDFASNELDYLHERTAFYQQLLPPKATTSDTCSERTRSASSEQSVTSTDQLIELMEEVEYGHSQGEYQMCLRKCEMALTFIRKQLYTDLPKRDEFEATFHSFMGNAHFELDELRLALQCHQRDLEIANKLELEEARSRALDNIGRTNAKMGQHEKAIETFEMKLGLIREPLEAAWLHHELGRSHLELKQLDKAQDHGEKSLSAAEEVNDLAWRLNASVLLAQTHVAMEKEEEGLRLFETALNLAQEDQDQKAEKALKVAIEDLRDKMNRTDDTTEKVDGNGDLEHDAESDPTAADIAAEIKASNATEREETAEEIRDEIRESNEKNSEDEKDEMEKIVNQIKDSNEKSRQNQETEKPTEKSSKETKNISTKNKGKTDKKMDKKSDVKATKGGASKKQGVNQKVGSNGKNKVAEKGKPKSQNVKGKSPAVSKKNDGKKTKEIGEESETGRPGNHANEMTAAEIRDEIKASNKEAESNEEKQAEVAKDSQKNPDNSSQGDIQQNEDDKEKGSNDKEELSEEQIRDLIKTGSQSNPAANKTGQGQKSAEKDDFFD